ncbi:MAG: S8 family peptidase [Anaerolineaceae bacterium]
MNRKKLPHLYLKNLPGSVNKFNKSRFVKDTDVPRKDPAAYKQHKQKLHASFIQLIQDRRFRIEQKTLIAEHIEIVEIRFFIPFSDGKYDTKSRFLNEFGLSPVVQQDFNRTIYFAIVNIEKFKRFDVLLKEYIDSNDQTAPQGTNYAIMTTIYDVKYHTSGDIRNYCVDDLIFELINNNAHIDRAYEAQKKELINFLSALESSHDIKSFNIDPYEKTVQVRGVDETIVTKLVDNFDILARAHSLRTPKVKPDQYNVSQLSWDFTIINSDQSDRPLIGIIDNGVSPIEPIQQIVVGGQDLTSTENALSASNKHGTVVATLAAVGERYFEGGVELTTDARIYSIKILENFEGYIDVLSIIEAIRTAHRDHGVRLFNLSVSKQFKQYNEAPSSFAYLLDKLAYELDILIFIAAGNMIYDDIVLMQEDGIPQHAYPNHFYSPGSGTDIHSCMFTNICIPAESMNHITVGAIAENYRNGTSQHLSLDKKLPAYYSRKNHYDFKQEINGGYLSPNHANANWFKPDMVMPGGDLLHDDSAMQVLGLGEFGNDFYTYDAGTSLATPLALNLAVKLLNIYPDISLQSAKALLINSAETYSHSFLDNMVDKRKESIALTRHGMPFANLNPSEKAQITKMVLSAEAIYRNLVGHGRPNPEKLLYSSDDEVSFLIEDRIPTDHHKVFLLNIPDYLLDSSTSNCLDIQATLCFNINPAWGNHVDYNPLHISFNFANGAIENSLDELANILADRDHQFYRRLWTEDIAELEERKVQGILSETEINKLTKLKAKLKGQLIGVKTRRSPWSEDFFPLVNRPLSNRQKLSIILAKRDIEKIGNKLVVVMRCAVKENLDVELEEWKRIIPEHSFSLAIRITDKSTQLEERSLYEELQAINEIEIVQNTIAEIHETIEAET